MRKTTSAVVNAFVARQSRKVNNTSTDGTGFFLHGNRIAEWRGSDLWITSAGWFTSTTKERLNGLPGVRVFQRNGDWFLNGNQWNGEWTKI